MSALTIPKIRVVRRDGSSDVYPIYASTQVALEDKFGIALSEMKSQRHYFFLGWDAEHEAGKTVKPYDDWLKEIATCEDAETDAEKLRAVIKEAQEQLAEIEREPAINPTSGVPSRT